VSSSERIIGVPWKGRNFGRAAEEVFEDTFYDAEFLAEQFNGKSKKEARSGDISQEFLDEVSKTGWSSIGRFMDTGRESPRFGFDTARTREGLVEGYSGDPFDSGYDEVFVPDDRGLETVIDSPVDLEEYESSSGKKIYLGESAVSRGRIDLGDVLEDYVEGYSPGERPGGGVSLSAMVSEELEEGEEVEKVLVSEDIEFISVSVGDYVWEDVEYETFRSYADRKDIDYDDEEELVGLQPEVAGVYIVDTGGTADENGLEYERVAGTGLRRWTRTSENSYKELEDKTSPEAVKI
jgi:hypothetical protein